MNSAQHLWQYLSGKKTYLISLAATIYAWGITHSLWSNEPTLDVMFAGGVLSALRHGWTTEAAKIIATILESPPVLPSITSVQTLTPALSQGERVTPSTVATSKSGSVHLPTLFAIFGAVCLCCIPLLVVVPGCASLQPGADPFVVRVEQAQASAKPGFDFLLSTENANREFWRTNAPGLYSFCEWLRQPQAVTGPTAFGTNISMDLPRASAMQWNLDQVKGAYKSGRASSNEVFIVLDTLEAAVGQAATWGVVLTNHP